MLTDARNEGAVLESIHMRTLATGRAPSRASVQRSIARPSNSSSEHGGRELDVTACVRAPAVGHHHTYTYSVGPTRR